MSDENVKKKVAPTNVKELRKLVREVFAHYGEKKIYEEKFFDYLRKKGYSDKEIKKIWIRALGHGIIRWGVDVFADEIPIKQVKKKYFLELVRG